MDLNLDSRTEDGGLMTTDKANTTVKNTVPHIRFRIPVREGGRRMIERSVNAYFRGEPDVLQVKDVVRLLHCSKNTVYALIKSGTLECVKVGRNLLIPKALLVEFLMRDKNIFVLRPDPPRRR
jgi:excisionase family DNA binding protein